jgi:hypothetical protein
MVISNFHVGNAEPMVLLQVSELGCRLSQLKGVWNEGQI